MISILLVDDEINWLKSLQRTISQNGITDYDHIFIAQNKSAALDILSMQEIDLVFLDLNMGAESGEDLLKIVKNTYPHKTVVIMTGLNKVQLAVNCLKQGADDYFTKTMKVDELIVSIKRIIKVKNLEAENRAIKHEYLNSDCLNDAFSRFISQSPKIISIFKYLQAIAPSNQPILITGESGVGKGVLAKVIANISRPDRPFISVNVAGLDNQMFTDTLFGHIKGAYTNAQNSRQGMVLQARDGTVFLDEIGDLPIQSQLKLLYLTQDGEYQQLGSDTIAHTNARFIFATNQDLTKKLDSGEFRRDLFFRLNTHHVHIPPLRERREDIVPLIEFFMKQIALEYNMDLPYVPDNVIKLLQGYDFPGNVRQLKAVIYDAVMKAQEGVLSVTDFKSLFLDTMEITEEDKRLDEIPTVDEALTALIKKAMAATGGNQAKAASMLGISLSTLSRKLKKLK